MSTPMSSDAKPAFRMSIAIEPPISPNPTIVTFMSKYSVFVVPCLYSFQRFIQFLDRGTQRYSYVPVACLTKNESRCNENFCAIQDLIDPRFDILYLSGRFRPNK